MNVNFVYNQHKRMRRDSSEDNSSEEELSSYVGSKVPKPGKKTRGRVKVKMELIKSKLRRYTTFSKRKTGIMKKAYELATLTGTQVMILVASETGHVYTFATQKLQPMITSDAGKALIQTCLNSPDPPPAAKDYRMSETGYEEVDLSYHVQDEDTNYSTPDVDDPHDSIAASNSQVSSRDPSPDLDIIPDASPEPPLMTIPPHVMQELLKTAQNKPEPQLRSMETISSIPVNQGLKNSTLTLKDISTPIVIKQKNIVSGPLSFQGQFQKKDDLKVNVEQPKMTMFRPIKPNNQQQVDQLQKHITNPQLRIFKNIAPAPPPNLLPLPQTKQNLPITPLYPNLPRLVLPPVSHTSSHPVTDPHNFPQPRRK